MNASSLIGAVLQGGSAAIESHDERKERRLRRDMALAEALERRRVNDSAILENTARAQAALNPQPKSRSLHDDYTDYYDSLIQAGKPPEVADRETRMRFGRNQERDQNPTFGSPEYLEGVEKVTKIRNANRPSSRTNSSRAPLSDASRREAYFRALAKRAIAGANGDPQKAAESLVQNPQTKDVFSQGMSSDHLLEASRTFKTSRAYEAPAAAAPVAKPGAITRLGYATEAPKPDQRGPSEQQRDWDAAAAALRKSGVSNPAEKIGPRPAR